MGFFSSSFSSRESRSSSERDAWRWCLCRFRPERCRPLELPRVSLLSCCRPWRWGTAADAFEGDNRGDGRGDLLHCRDGRCVARGAVTSAEKKDVLVPNVLLLRET